ncbi:hypothetical protein [Wenzhouxiangella sp. AB-CW3]|uniref:hypothetical protein n=1 Tax=Wenzhouxiangella sp. AB-CW3 TaxID=2771012 RepID=UPI001CC3150E|nr:hypothetical protein [Wenzhouxiangella sp. AB-CW3]
MKKLSGLSSENLIFGLMIVFAAPVALILAVYWGRYSRKGLIVFFVMWISLVVVWFVVTNQFLIAWLWPGWLVFLLIAGIDRLVSPETRNSRIQRAVAVVVLNLSGVFLVGVLTIPITSLYLLPDPDQLLLWFGVLVLTLAQIPIWTKASITPEWFVRDP